MNNWKKRAFRAVLSVGFICIAAAAGLMLHRTVSENEWLSASGTTYVSDECIYMNPLSSYAALDGDSGCTYTIREDSFEIVHRNSGEQKVIRVKSWKWQTFPYTDEEWETLYVPAADKVSNISERYREIRYLPLTEDRFLMRADGDLWIVELSSDRQMGTCLWSIYRLIPESERRRAEMGIQKNGT